MAFVFVLCVGAIFFETSSFGSDVGTVQVENQDGCVFVLDCSFAQFCVKCIDLGI